MEQVDDKAIKIYNESEREKATTVSASWNSNWCIAWNNRRFCNFACNKHINWARKH